MKKWIWVVLIVLCGLVLASCAAFGMKHLPEGELLESVPSPDGAYQVNAYLVDGGATVDYSVRCEVVDAAASTKRNIYWNYHCEEAEIRWLDDVTVEINGVRLNVQTDSYDWRRE